MNISLAFFKKEIKEIAKTSKIITLPAVFLFFAILSAFSARYIKEIMMSLGEESILSAIPDPVYIDSYVQFFKNANFIYVLTIIAVFMGSVLDEKIRGTASMVLTKNLGRSNFVISKLIAAVLFFTVSYAASFCIFLYYTYIMFSKVFTEGTWAAFFVFWLYGVFIISLVIFSSTICKNNALTAVVSIAGYALASAISAIPKAGIYSPGALQSIPLELIAGTRSFDDIYISLIATVGVTAILAAASIFSFKKQEL